MKDNYRFNDVGVIIRNGKRFPAKVWVVQQDMGNGWLPPLLPEHTATYIMRRECDGVLKIGRSKSPARRQITLITEMNTYRAVEGLPPTNLSIIFIGSEHLERQLHRQFAHLRIAGEWFLPGVELLKYIRHINEAAD